MVLCEADTRGVHVDIGCRSRLVDPPGRTSPVPGYHLKILEHELSNIPCGYDSEHTQRVLGACPEFAFSPLGGVGEQCLPTAVFAASASNGMMSYELY